MHKILLSADTPCDIGPALKERYHVSLYPLHILLDEKQYTDGKDISLDDLYSAWRERKTLPRTAAINPEEYAAYFKPYLDDGYEIIHISLGSGLSSSYQNAQLAAKSLGNGVYVIDSCSLSTGFGLLVCEAGERIKQGLDAETIYHQISALTSKTSASFVIDTLEFLHAGGRCSGLAHLGADLLSLKPTITVRTDKQGAMTVGKKYMGRLDRALMKYVDDQLEGRRDILLNRVFVTYSTMDPALVKAVCSRVLSHQPFEELFVTTASCTIGAHCGPNTLGVLFLTK